MELKNYDYASKPFSFLKFDIFPLSNKGINQYVSPNSYIHKYIDKGNLINIQRNPKNYIKEKVSNINIENDNENNYNEIECENNDHNNQNNDNDIYSNFQANKKINKTQSKFFTNSNCEKKSRPFSSMVTNKSICSFYGKSNNNYLDLKRIEYKNIIYRNSMEYSNNIRIEKSFFSNSNNYMDNYKDKDKDYLIKKNYDKFKSFQGINSLKNLKKEKEYTNMQLENNENFNKTGRSTSFNFKKTKNKEYNTKNNLNIFNINQKRKNIITNNNVINKKPLNLTLTNTNQHSYSKIFNKRGKSLSKIE
jgi:hypothetical protein